MRVRPEAIAVTGSALVRSATEVIVAFLLCSVAAGCVTLRSHSAGKTESAPSREPATNLSGISTTEALQRLSIARPLEGGIDVPVVRLQVHGYLMVDAADYFGSNAYGGTQLTVRRADINFRRGLWNDWLFYANSQVIDWRFEFKDLYLRRHYDTLGVVTVGNQQEPFGLEQYGSFKNTVLLEPTTSNALAPSRSIGVSARDKYRRWRWMYGIFLAGLKDEDRKARGEALTGRLVYLLPVQGGLYHLAINYSDRKTESVKLKSTSEVSLDTTYFLDTGTIPGAENLERRGIEAAHVSGPYSWQAEYMEATVRRTDFPRLHFTGWYGVATVMLTADTRAYDDTSATFGEVVPNSPWDGRRGGALELALRLSQTDLNSADIVGGKEVNLSLGLNWYLDRSLRLSTNIVQALELDRTGNPYDGHHPTAVVGRVQYQF